MCDFFHCPFLSLRRNCSDLAFKHIPSGKYIELWHGTGVVCGKSTRIQ